MSFDKKARGGRFLQRHLDGARLSASQAAVAKCYECCCSYHDGKVGCGIPGCPLYPWMPYRGNPSDTPMFDAPVALCASASSKTPPSEPMSETSAAEAGVEYPEQPS
jgi:hypothetical protein